MTGRGRFLSDERQSSVSAQPPVTALISPHGMRHALDSLMDGFVRCLAIEQFQDGHWGNGGDERPLLIPESPIPGTALAARAVRLDAIPARAREMEASVVRARAYLLSSKPHGCGRKRIRRPGQRTIGP